MVVSLNIQTKFGVMGFHVASEGLLTTLVMKFHQNMVFGGFAFSFVSSHKSIHSQRATLVILLKAAASYLLVSVLGLRLHPSVEWQPL